MKMRFWICSQPAFDCITHITWYSGDSLALLVLVSIIGREAIDGRRKSTNQPRELEWMRKIQTLVTNGAGIQHVRESLAKAKRRVQCRLNSSPMSWFS
ncbi:hypothetical protein BO83DRAFT_146608 [Aspergillus eucalypticola CBS 122712]|uniref:Uncharacterized protein n=1 Tax=Aspergillus eucalypticola (strain CBS 122712 / IBT 29274) TaxID=1448314 RepID=A0A317UQB7_ASPEC|nr:uncharacterized protein BO83DRAFT_146608 [Aspergillus eucalypticola CBS 122712]PWY64193.1 hypothetical protein BO83DRAFT_146608 [Aspergillus eucalypticola CBS 122712]